VERALLANATTWSPVEFRLLELAVNLVSTSQEPGSYCLDPSKAPCANSGHQAEYYLVVANDVCPCRNLNRSLSVRKLLHRCCHFQVSITPTPSSQWSVGEIRCLP
jgi:hypothetical protein